jgi:hypothetical protein
VPTFTVGGLAEELATELGEAYGDQDVNFQFRRWVAEGVAEICEFAEWFFTLATSTIVTVAGTSTYALPADCGSIRYLVDSSTGDRLSGVRADDLLRGGHRLTTQATPTHWFLTTLDPSTTVVSVQFYPVPNAVKTYALHYTKLTPELEEETDVVPLPYDAMRAVRNFVRASFYDNAGEGALADKHRERFTEALLALQKRYQNSPGIERQMQYNDLPRARTRLPMPRFPRTIT